MARDKWSYRYTSDPTASQRWIVDKNGEQWCAFHTEEEAREYVEEQRRNG